MLVYSCPLIGKDSFFLMRWRAELKTVSSFGQNLFTFCLCLVEFSLLLVLE